MLNQFPFPSGGRISLHAALLILLVSFSHCQKKNDTPSPPKLAQDLASGTISEGIFTD